MTTKTNTKPAPTRCPWQQGFRDALQRLSVTLMLVMLTASAWAQVIPQTIYRLSLNANYQGGAIGMVDVPVSNPTYTLASYNEPTREGYMFCGWSTSSTGAVQYRTNDQITLTGNLTLYAVWDDNPYIITLNTNYDGGVFKSILVPRNHPNYTLTSRDEPTHTEYTFIGWSQSPTGVVDYRTGNKVTLNGNLTFYAVWGGTVNSLTYTITDEEKRQVELFEYEEDEPEGTLNIPSSVTISGKEFSVTSIGNSVFSDCSSLQSVTIPNSVTNIGDNAFSWCEKLQSVIIPESVTRFGNSVFWACTSLRSVIIPESVTSIGEECFRYCTSLQSVIIPESVTSIENDVFMACTGLQSVTIPNSVTRIGDTAFDACTSLRSITIPNSVTTIGGGAFEFCSNLQSVTIPNSVTTIGDAAFFDCSSLESVTIFAPELDEYGGSAFDRNADGRKIYVFSDCVETYKSEWSKYANAIEAIPALAVRDAGGELGSWCTYYNGLADVTVADGTTVYTAKQNNAGGVTLTETGSNIIKRGEAVLLKSAANVDLSSAASSGDGVYDGNELQGVDVETPQDANTTYYVLSKVNGIFGFYKLARENNNSEPIKLGANKAYLEVASTTAPAYFGFDENTTAISEHESHKSYELSGERYSLDGRKLQGMPTQKGLYIVNGKKIVIK